MKANRLAMLFLLSALLAAMDLPALELQGPLVQGGVVIGRTAPGTPVRLDDRPVRVSAEGLFVLGFD
ncbi:MAG: M23 family peptidase, partial [Gammaproteobacteria bacterium]